MSLADRVLAEAGLKRVNRASGAIIKKMGGLAAQGKKDTPEYKALKAKLDAIEPQAIHRDKKEFAAGMSGYEAAQAGKERTKQRRRSALTPDQKNAMYWNPDSKEAKTGRKVISGKLKPSAKNLKHPRPRPYSRTADESASLFGRVVTEEASALIEALNITVQKKCPPGFKRGAKGGCERLNVSAKPKFQVHVRQK